MTNPPRSDIIVTCTEGSSSMVESTSPKRVVAGSSPVSPAKKPEYLQVFRLFYHNQVHASSLSIRRFLVFLNILFLPACVSV